MYIGVFNFICWWGREFYTGYGCNNYNYCSAVEYIIADLLFTSNLVVKYIPEHKQTELLLKIRLPCQE